MRTTLFILLLAFTATVTWADDNTPVKANAGTGEADPKRSFPPLPKKVMDAKSCGTIDLRNDMGPAKDQFGADCYAHAATELINFETKPKQYSAFNLAARSDGFNTGFLNKALAQAKSLGVCPEAYNPTVTNGQVDSDVVLSYYGKSMVGEKRVHDECKYWMSWRHPLTKEGTDAYKQYYNEKFQEAKYDESIYKKKIDGKVAKQFKKDEMYEHLKKIFPTLSADVMEEVFYSADNARYDKDPRGALDHYLQLLSRRACPLEKHDFPLNKTKVIVNHDPMVNDSLSNASRVALLGSINRGLGEGKPVGVNLFTKGVLNTGGAHAKHSVAVAGRKWDAGKNECVYVLKNSWGKFWTPKAGADAESLPNGYFTLTESQMTESVYGASYIHFDPQ